MIRVVIDTSVLVSAVISPAGPNAQVLDLITTDKLKPCLSDAILAEYRVVFSYQHLTHLSPERINLLTSLLEAAAEKVQPTQTLEISKHESDNRIYEFYECADAAGADYIVTENTRHFKEGIGQTQIVNARQLLRLLRAEEK